MNQKWIFDIETYPSCFSFAVIREDGAFPNTFEVSYRKNDIARIIACMDYLHAQDDYMVGFNNNGFDYPVLHELLELRDKRKMPTAGEARHLRSRRQ